MQPEEQNFALHQTQVGNGFHSISYYPPMFKNPELFTS